MWFKIKLYILFLFKSTNKHGVHSPFVFHLITKCFNRKTDLSQKNKFIKVKKWLLKDETILNVTDFGSGSKVFKMNERKVSDISKVAGIRTKNGLLLIRLIDYFKPKSILEIGTSVGLSSTALSIGNSNAKIISLEGCPNTANYATQLFERFNLSNIEVVTGEFNQTLPNIIHNKSFDFIYFDGNHTQKATLNYFTKCLKTTHNNSIFIFDDINLSKEMHQAWNIIKEHPKVTVTINTFYWGIVFFRKEQNKQHFTIRL
ncbi:MAG: class I SAM-dependent methyltransferase [Lutibacter sp.]|uniref:O-methyltransferase n=1 Tax=Lutibacter sp. TaxID=1925666 RepID=UPI00299E1D95|nr:class I SAM-dependent methyltransferase [Lutibacter sp.]MDX1827941.1 class I SAM-dependent methyltransferase [Lutibacter sp.]